MQAVTLMYKGAAGGVDRSGRDSAGHVRLPRPLDASVEEVARTGLALEATVL